ncbi:hypothetical protein ACFWJT_15625 [Streptomyces sp. NPDC127069]|uniref:zinc finger domain-containing protein n=1 Tax=Streptomyces sp. NPDC127069 TaxID=3347128 RepID=UPI00366368FF
MTPTEASDLLTRCAAFDNRGASAAAAIAWASALKDVPLDDDAFAAVDRYYGTTQAKPGERLWIQPHNVRAHRLAIRKERLGETLPAYEPPLEGETGAEFIRRRRAQLEAVATGRATGRPVGALTGPPHPSVVRALEGIGRAVPDPEAAAAADAARLADEVRRSGPLGIACPQCSAAIGRPCKRPSSSDKQPIGKPRATPHSARIDAARGVPAVSAEQRAEEERRQREASARHLARIAEEQQADVESEAS